MKFPEVLVDLLCEELDEDLVIQIVSSPRDAAEVIVSLREMLLNAINALVYEERGPDGPPRPSALIMAQVFLNRGPDQELVKREQR